MSEPASPQKDMRSKFVRVRDGGFSATFKCCLCDALIDVTGWNNAKSKHLDCPAGPSSIIGECKPANKRPNGGSDD
ncbi:MAG: hypothetical protein V3T88_01565 [Nitrosomonadaceae bacterium]